MRTHWKTCWQFNTQNLNVLFQVTPCRDDPANSFEFPEDIDAVRNGDVDWFDARVVVQFRDGTELGSDYLGCCAYRNVAEFYTAHRQSKGGNYFPDMVREAIGEARKRLHAMGDLRLRAA